MKAQVLLIGIWALSSLAGQPRIYILHSYLPGEWVHGINTSFIRTLEQLGVQPTLKSEIFHSSHWLEQTRAGQTQERQRLLASIKAHGPDLLVVCDDEAADFLVPSLSGLGLPVLAVGINRPLLSSGVMRGPTDIGGTLETYQFGKSMDVLRRMGPTVKSFSILSSASPTSTHVAGLLADWADRDGRHHGVTLRQTILSKHWSRWKTAVADMNAKDQAAWILVPYDVVDESGGEISIERMGDWMSQNLRIPTLGIISIHTRIGLLAAIHIGPEALGRQAAEQAARFFRGTPLRQIGFEDARYYRFEINQETAMRLHLRIPPELMPIASFVKRQPLTYGR